MRKANAGIRVSDEPRSSNSDRSSFRFLVFFVSRDSCLLISPGARLSSWRWRTSRHRDRVFWIFNLHANSCEEFRDSRHANTIGNEGRDQTTGVSVNEIGGASFGCAIGLEQPFALAKFYAHDAFLFRRPEFIRRGPMAHKN